MPFKRIIGALTASDCQHLLGNRVSVIPASPNLKRLVFSQEEKETYGFHRAEATERQTWEGAAPRGPWDRD